MMSQLDMVSRTGSVVTAGGLLALRGTLLSSVRYSFKITRKPRHLCSKSRMFSLAWPEVVFDLLALFAALPMAIPLANVLL